MYVKTAKPLEKFYVEIIEEELNVKEVLFTDSISSFISYSLSQTLRLLVRNMVNISMI